MGYKKSLYENISNNQTKGKKRRNLGSQLCFQESYYSLDRTTRADKRRIKM